MTLKVLEIEDLTVPTSDDWLAAGALSDEDYDLIMGTDREARAGRPPVDDWSWENFD